MKIIVVLKRQTWFDISIQYTGNVYNALAIAWANNRSLSDVLAGGESLIMPDGLILSPKEIQYFTARNILPATGGAVTGLEDNNEQNEGYELPAGFPISF